MANKQAYIVLIERKMIRDAQVCLSKDAEPLNDDEWIDFPDIRAYLGIYSAVSEEDATEKAAKENGIDPSGLSALSVSVIEEKQRITNQILQWVENGEINVSDPLESYLPRKVDFMVSAPGKIVAGQSKADSESPLWVTVPEKAWEENRMDAVAEEIAYLICSKQSTFRLVDQGDTNG